MNKNFDPLPLLTEAYQARKLLLVWADVPFPPQEALTHPAALLINRWQSQAAQCAPVPWATGSLPPLPILSLDPTARLEVSAPNAAVVTTLRDVVVQGRPTVLKLAGDLASRTGLFLTWDDVSAARSQRDKAHILREAARVAEGGVVLVLATNPNATFERFWARLLAPALRDAARILVLGPEDYAWPAPLHCIGPIENATAIFSQLSAMRPSPPRTHVQPETAQLDHTGLQIRIGGFSNAEDGYPVEAQLSSGAYFAAGRLHLDASAFQKPTADPASYGADLFDALFTGPVRDTYLRAKTLAGERSGGRLRLRLWIDPDAADLHAIPWESMQYPLETRRLPLAASAKLPFSRYTRLSGTMPEPVSARPLKMLIVIANPADLESEGIMPLDIETEVANVVDTLAEIPSDQLQLTLLPGRTGLSATTQARILEAGHQLHAGPSTLLALLELLSRNMYHILHIVAHGRFNRTQETAALCLEDGDGYAQWVDASDLAVRLAQVAALPHLIFLSACESATRVTGNRNPFVGLAPQLVEIGVPAVVAMQDTIPVVLARQLTRAFYMYLLAHGIVDRALNQARLQLYDTRHTDWMTPVLFMRLREGQLFAV